MKAYVRMGKTPLRPIGPSQAELRENVYRPSRCAWVTRLGGSPLAWRSRSPVSTIGCARAKRRSRAATRCARATAAQALLARVPHSPLALALLADACEAAGLDAELALTLEELAVRVAVARGGLGAPRARARARPGRRDETARRVRARARRRRAGQRGATRGAPLARRSRSAHGDGARAELWLERLADRQAAQTSRSDAPRRGSSRTTSKGARAAARRPRDATRPTGARRSLRGRALAIGGDAAAFPPLLRAMVLEAPGASEALSSGARVAPDATRPRARRSAPSSTDSGETSLARWKAAFARAEGRRDEARAALVDAVRAGDASRGATAARRALDDQDSRVARRRARARVAPSRHAPTTRRRAPPPLACSPRIPARPPAILDELAARRRRARVAPWADARARAALAAWIPTSGAPGDWDALLTRLDRARARAPRARRRPRRSPSSRVERSRPVRVAIVGEFNAGKSTFINALIGADVAPTGVLPTTATLHHLRYAPDPFARIQFYADAPTAPKERIVPSSELRAALKAMRPGAREARRDPPAHRVAHARRDPRHARLQRARAAPHRRRALGVRGGRRRDLAPRRRASR